MNNAGNKSNDIIDFNFPVNCFSKLLGTEYFLTMPLKKTNDRIDDIELELLEMLLKDLKSLDVENDMNDCSEYL